MQLPYTHEKEMAINAVINSIQAIENEKLKIINNDPIYIELLKGYRQVIMSLKEKSETISIPLVQGEVYSREHNFSNGAIFEYTWSMFMIDKLIKNDRRIIKKKFDLNSLSKWIDVFGIEPSRLSYALNNQAPVYVIDFAPVDVQILINGNHRVFSRLQKYGDAQQQISGYLIPSKVHVKAMASDYQKTFYKIMANLGQINKYLDLLSIEGRASKPDLFAMSITNVFRGGEF